MHSEPLVHRKTMEQMETGKKRLHSHATIVSARSVDDGHADIAENPIGNSTSQYI